MEGDEGLGGITGHSGTSSIMSGTKKRKGSTYGSTSEKRQMSALDVMFSKYKAASLITQNALQMVVSQCKPDAKILDLCVMADNYIIQETSKVLQKKKGIAFPTCISVNNTVCYCSPLATDVSFLKENDMVKIDMACHVDGFIATVAHSFVIRNGPVTGRAADVLAAAEKAAGVAMSLVRPGQKNKAVYEAVKKVAAAYDCQVVGDVPSYHLKQFGRLPDKFDAITSNKVADKEEDKFDAITSNKVADKEEDFEFQLNEAYAIDITMSTGDGKPKLLDKDQTTIFKWNGNVSNLRTSGINIEFPFTARSLEEGILSKMKSKKQNLLKRYHMLHEGQDQLVAHLKFTVLLKPDGPQRITYHAIQELQSPKGAISLFSELPTDLLFQVFSLLQPVPFIRCSCVCKNWYQSATDSTYLQQRYHSKNQHPLIYFMGTMLGAPTFRIQTLNLETLGVSTVGVDIHSGCRVHRHKLVDCFSVHGSCNGVLLFSFHDTLYLSNHVTKHWSQLPYSLKRNEMLFLYHHTASNSFRILKKIDEIELSSYSVIELDPDTSEWNERHVAVRSRNAVVDPVPVQLLNYLYWIHEEDRRSVISVFDTISETLSSRPAPPLAEKQAVFWTVLLDLNGELAASVSWAEGSPENFPKGPTHIELWYYTDGNWESKLQVAIPESLHIHLIKQLGINVSWPAFICNENGQFLVSVRNNIRCYDKDGNVLMEIENGESIDDNQKLSGLFLKESFLLSPTLLRRFDRKRRLPPFFFYSPAR